MMDVSNFKLTEAMVESFYRVGFFYAPGFITPDAVNAINKEHIDFAFAESDGKWKKHAIAHIDEENKKAYPDTVIS